MDFIYTTSNIRAFKFNIYQKDKLSIMKIAKNIIPAISTTISIATSMSLYELYKIPLVMDYILYNENFPQPHKLRGKNFKSCGDMNISKYSSGYNIWYTINDGILSCFNRNKLILTLKLFNYDNKISNLYLNNFFNLSNMKYYFNHTNPPNLFTLHNPRALLDGISLSFWDYMLIGGRMNKDIVGINGGKNGECGGDKMGFGSITYNNDHHTSSVELHEVVHIIQELFNVKVTHFMGDESIIEVKPGDKRTLDDLFHTNDVIKIIAIDHETLENMELPYLKME